MHEKHKSELIEAYLELRPELRRFLVAWFRNEATAEDVLQDMYLKLDRTDLSAPIQNMKAFLYKVAENLALDWRKKNLRSKGRDTAWSETTGTIAGEDAVADAPDPDAAIDAKRKLEAVLAALKDLSPQSRNVFVLHKLKGLTHREVAEKLGIRQKGVEKHMTKALKHLVKYLKGMD